MTGRPLGSSALAGGTRVGSDFKGSCMLTTETVRLPCQATAECQRGDAHVVLATATNRFIAQRARQLTNVRGRAHGALQLLLRNHAVQTIRAQDDDVRLGR